ncbi:MAG: alpha/beta hydrolase [Eubacteriales bacterium]|nr:alpha/beta hydrolase [Eubacteriales bacterium]
MLQQSEQKISEAFYEKYVTIYRDTDTEPKACILYFHGGGLLYGLRTDLPDGHIKALTEAGYLLIAFDYPLAPAVKLDRILEDVCDSVNYYLEGNIDSIDPSLPYVLWGRSSGAYLCLLAATCGKCKRVPAAVLSYYGYGFLCDGWFDAPAPYYRALPAVDASCLDNIDQTVHANGDLDTHYMIYVHARQTGTWRELIYEGRMKFFYLNYSLRLCDKFPCPLFCAHSINDPDVPYKEFLELCNRYSPKRYIASCAQHDFDREEGTLYTRTVLDATITFLKERI